MEAVSLLALCDWKPPVTGGFPSRRPVTQSVGGFFFICEQKFEQATETPVIWYAIALIMTSL